MFFLCRFSDNSLVRTRSRVQIPLSAPKNKRHREGVSYFLCRNIAGFEGEGGSVSEPFAQKGKGKERMSANRTAR